MYQDIFDKEPLENFDNDMYRAGYCTVEKQKTLTHIEVCIVCNKLYQRY